LAALVLLNSIHVL